jgi:phosphoribosylformylglycinamidine cyclo-ligase
MLRTFNCGIGMVLVVDDQSHGEVERIFIELGETLIPMGRLIPQESGHRVLFSGQVFP